jgi:predicted enzyme involved in methoxymalonyl-ACP biosynthesis
LVTPVLTGIIILKDANKASGTINIDSFLISCRIIGRKIETKFPRLRFELLRTGKLPGCYFQFRDKKEEQRQVKDYLFKSSVSSHDTTEDSATYKLVLGKYQPVNINFIKIIEE